MSFPRRTRRELSPGRFNRWRPSLPKAERGFLACTHTNNHTKQNFEEWFKSLLLFAKWSKRTRDIQEVYIIYCLSKSLVYGIYRDYQKSRAYALRGNNSEWSQGLPYRRKPVWGRLFQGYFLDFQRVKTLARILVKKCPKAPGLLRGWGARIYLSIT